MSNVPSANQSDSTVPILPGQRFTIAPIRLPLTPILGRGQVVSQICEMLDTDTIRLLTLTGAGGIGKTRVALEVASRLEAEYAHGACFVPLAPVQDASHVIPAIAQALGIRETNDMMPLAGTLTTVLRDRHLLLVLDNFEHVADAAVPWLGDTLAMCPRLTVLVTSRAALHVAGERRYSVPSLTVPESGSFATLSANAAVRLFAERAVAIRDDFVLDEANADIARDICHQVDGIPLAIELAAARVNVLSPNDIVTRLADRLAFLSSADRDLPARHRTMRDAIGWSYDLLSGPEQMLFRRLAVFVGGFAMEAAEAVGTMRDWHADSGQIVDAVASLADHSLVRHGAIGRGESRFWMLESIRQFGLERLAVHGEEAVARDAHAAWYLRMGVEAELGLQGGDQVVWLDRLESEHENLRLVFRWLFEQERLEDAADLAVHIMFFRFIRGHRREFRPYLKALLEHPLLAQPTLARGKALVASGGAILGMGDSELAMLALREALPIFRAHGERGYAATTLASIGLALLSRDDFDGATTVFEESVSLAREVKSGRIISAGLSNLGLVAWIQGRMDDALALQEEGLRVARDGEDACLVAQIIGDLGEMAFNRGDYDQAEPLFQESMDLISALGDRRDLPHVSIELAKIARIRGDYAAASAYLEEALEVAREIGDLSEVASSLMALGKLTSLRGKHGDAVQPIRQSITTFQQLGGQSGIAECLDALADVAVRTRDMASAARMIGAADAALGRISIPRTEGLAQQEHEERMTALRSALGEVGFVTAYDAGRAMTLELAVAFALAFEPVDDVPAPTLPAKALGLTPRELEVLRMMADGLTNQEIADALFLSRRTATSHASNILGKLGPPSRTAAVAFTIRHGLA